MSAATSVPRLTSFAPQFLVDNLERSIAFYRDVLGFTFRTWEDFYAIGTRDGLEIHLKLAPKNPAERQHRKQNEHLDASAGVRNIEAFYAQVRSNGASIIKPLTKTEWSTQDFYLEDPDGYILCFGGT
jgi:catechol 2,3-dioxygenase-like lactoylglutathione lyase family enzyme